MARAGSVFVRIRSSFPSLLATLLFTCSAALALQQNPVPDQAKAPKNSEAAIPLEPGKPVRSEFAAGAKRAYLFDMGQRQYTTIHLDCPKLHLMTKLFDSSGNPVDRTSGNNRWNNEDIELATENSGGYKLEVNYDVLQGPSRNCVIVLGNTRPASEKDLSLQQARSLIATAAALMGGGKGLDAINQIEKAVGIRERILGIEDPSLAYPLYLLGTVYLNKPDYPRAGALYERALKLQEKAAPESPLLFSILNNSAIIFIETDQLELAEKALLHAISVGENLYGPGAPATGNSVVNLGNLYDEKGDYIKAQAMFEKAWADGAKALGRDYPGLAVIIANLAGVYSERGDYSGAVRLAQQAVAIADKPGRKEDQRLALALVALADAYRFQDDLDRAEPLYQRSLKIYEQVAGADDPLVADNLAYLADISLQRHAFAKAEDLYQKSLTIRQKTLGKESSGAAESLDNLASLRLLQGDYIHAEPLFQQALGIRDKVFGHEHPQVAETLTGLSAVEMAMGNEDKAESYLSQAIEITEHNAEFNLTAGSERQKLAYVQLSSSQLDQAITLSENVASDQAARNLAITTVLQRKGRVLDTLAESLHAMRQRLGPEGSALLAQFDDVTSHLARLTLSTSEPSNAEERQRRITALKEQREKLEAEISLRSAQFRAAKQPVTLDAVRAALPPGTALIEFVHYQRFLPASLVAKSTRAQARYIAYVVRPSGPAQWKDLGDASELDRAIDSYRQALRDPRRNDVEKLSSNLDEKVLAPLRPLLGDVAHLLISPDGQLSLMPFEALMDAQKHYAVESYSITYLSTGRDLLRMQQSRPSKSRPMIVADPLFGESGTTLTAAVQHQLNPRDRRRSVTTAADLSAVYFAPLAGTAQEARTIQSLFPEATVLTGARASVAALKQAEAPSILHIATHGFFLEDRATAPSGTGHAGAAVRGLEATLDVDNPLLRSGLAFAGANTKRTGKDNGILTALEASTLNLWGTKLVTLSACDTGIGEIKDREGVYGLRRSFFLAGAETLVMSLWPVSDRVTREMMTSYYSALKRGLGRGEALRQAELAMMKRQGRRHPFYWASFIQSGEWATLDGKR